MAGIFDIADIPDWMNPTRNIIDTGKQENAQVAANFSSAFRESQAQAAKAAQADQDQQRIATKTGIMATALSNVKTPEDALDVFSKSPWMLVDKDTAKGAQAFLNSQIDVSKAQAASIAGKIAIADSSNFLKRLSNVTAKDRSVIGQMAPNPNGTPSPNQLTYLDLAEQTKEQNNKIATLTAQKQAQNRGDIPVATTITDKETGVTTKYAPPSQSGKPIVPQEMSLSDGSKIAFNPKTGSFKYLPKTGKEQDFTHAQLLNVAKAGLQVDSGNTNSLNIIKWLEDKAISQTQGSADLTNSTKSGLKYNIVPLK